MPSSHKIPVFSNSNPKIVATGLSRFCKDHKPPGTPVEDYLITLKIWKSSVGDLSASVHLPDSTKNPGVIYREVTLDKIEDSDNLSTILEEYQ